MFSHIESCKQRGQSQKSYCNKHGIAYSTFQYWAKKHREECTENNSPETPAGFIPVRVHSEWQEKSQVQFSNQLHFLYPNGVQLMCSETIDTEVLRNLLNP